MQITLVSLMAENFSPLYRDVTGYLARRTGLRLQIEEGVAWQERERMLDRGEAHVGFICGLPYVLRADRPEPPVELLAAPVMAAPRYAGRPIYFSDVIVRRGSPYRAFADLRGASWAYNEPGSQSGYNLTRWHLAHLGETRGFFGRVVEAGAHQVSLRMVVEGKVDASAIDSTVLERELEQHPELAPEVRIVETLGPSAMPPAVASTSLPPAARDTLRRALLAMHRDGEGRAILERARMRRFAPVSDRHYDDIRRMAREAQAVALSASSSRSSAAHASRSLSG